MQINFRKKLIRTVVLTCSIIFCMGYYFDQYPNHEIRKQISTDGLLMD